jgi:molybdenum cofactor cytidylyltransferase
MRRVSLMILAAGCSSRLGQPKQLLSYRGRSLVRHAAETGLLSICDSVVVVLGAYADEVARELRPLPVKIAHNPNWNAGMGASIRTGVQALTTGIFRGAYPDAVVITVCDQPFITAQDIDDIVRAHLISNSGIVASQYNETIGVPALFSRQYFSELLSLPDGAGAKSVMLRHADDLQEVALPGGSFDVDTADDFEKLQAYSHSS